ncbi:hypothetical protein E1301_Tti001838 [Triplophysa tibetana]|uniref:Uncharacterized protein n=1 Tax=Triplophysa tibetana TaxID=1572043 RepID=A0A5A9P9I9_9TELE|nr:hypothetical protein E1301_Tti001838 [Triplophysa tibetana]
MPKQIPAVPGTMRSHQVITLARGELIHRDVSCMCTTRQQFNCKSFNTQCFSFGQKVPTAVPQPPSEGNPQPCSLGNPQPSSLGNPHAAIEENPQPASEANPQPEKEIQWGSPELVGQWCMLKYDQELSPDIILGTDETQVQVKCMHCVGPNDSSGQLGMISSGTCLKMISALNEQKVGEVRGQVRLGGTASRVVQVNQADCELREVRISDGTASSREGSISLCTGPTSYIEEIADLDVPEEGGGEENDTSTVLFSATVKGIEVRIVRKCSSCHFVQRQFVERSVTHRCEGCRLKQRALTFCPSFAGKAILSTAGSEHSVTLTSSAVSPYLLGAGLC